MAKNKKKNGFYFFMKEMKERESRRGYNISMKDLPNHAHPLWKALSAREKEPYEEMARKFNKDPNLRGGKLASDGTRVEDNLREEEEFIRQRNKMKQDVKNFCSSDCVTDEQFKELAPRKLIYFMSFNIMCQKEDGTYIPIEVGLVEYSIQHGILREYTKILDPGRPPTGYAGAAKQLSEDKHLIDIYSKEGRENNMNVVYNELKEFTNPVGSDEYPPIFSEEKDVEITKGCLDWLAAVTNSENVFEVWNATYLLLELRAGVGFPLPSEAIAWDILNKPSFNYHPSTRCKFHEEQDVHFCALSYSKRLCYLISDAVCQYFDVQLTEKHIPTRANEEKAYTLIIPKETRHPFKSRPTAPSYHLDRRTNYYHNEESDEESEQFADNEVEIKQRPSVPRQPASTCLAEEMSNLRLNMTTATVPGHGIGRGIRRQ